MKVEAIEIAGGDLSIVNSARVSFAKESDFVDERDEKLITYLARHKHMTPFRHNFIQLRCEVPIFLARQLFKHQAGLTVNEVSRRYVDSMPDFHYPEFWRSRPEGGLKQGSGDVVQDNNYWVKRYGEYIVDCKAMYRQMLEEGIAPEMARMVLPQSMMVEFIWSGNLLAFSHVYNLRIGEGAQKEAQEFAKLLNKIIAPHFPVGWNALTHE